MPRCMGPAQGWTFSPGAPRMSTGTHKLGAYVEQPGDHDTFVLIGNDATGTWTRMPVMSDPARIAAVARDIAGPEGVR